MARTALFRKFAKLLKLSVAQQEKKLSDQDLAEILGAQRSGQVYKYLSRRGFISQAAASAGMMAGTGLSPLLIGCRTTATQSQVASTKLDHSGRIVIVGGGTAGLTAAYRLMQAGIGSSLYEGSERLGGRMYTENNFNAEGMFCERGGELVDTYHKDLQALCAELGLEIQEFSEDNESLVETIYYISGKVYYDEDIIASFKPLAGTLLRDRALLTRQGELSIPTYNSELAKSEAVRKLDQMSLAEYLNQVEAESWLKELIRICYVGEYGLEADKQSALNLVLLINPKTDEGFELFGESDESKRIKGGNEELPRALTRAIKSKVPVQLAHRLLAIKDNGQSFQLVFDNLGKTVEIAADQLILALPFSTLRLVDMSGLNLSPVKNRTIKEWGYGTNAKLMLGFSSRPWRTGPLQSSGSVYSNLQSQCFWETSHNQPGKSGIITNYLGGDSGRIMSGGAKLKSLADLAQIFVGVNKFFDGKSVLQHWPSHPFTLGSFTCSLPGQYTSIYGAAGEPELNGRLLFAGEHTSIDFSGFMNGAVESGNTVAQQIVMQKTKRAAAAAANPTDP